MTQTEQHEFIRTITSEDVSLTDSRFTMDNLYLGFKYKATDTYYKKANGEIIRRDRTSGERGIGNRTMPRVAFQIFGQQISKLSKQEKYDFPICR